MWFEDFVATKFCKGAACFMANHVMSSNGSFFCSWTCYVTFIEDEKRTPLSQVSNERKFRETVTLKKVERLFTI